MKTISRKQLYKNLRREMPKPTVVFEKDSKNYYNRKVKHKNKIIDED